jgi:uncharacterized protein YjbI with pentapeptide repeats
MKARLRQPVRPKLPVSFTGAELPANDIRDEGSYRSLEYVNVDLSKRDAASVDIGQCRFKRVSLAQTELDRALISDAVFEGCDLANLRARDCSFIRATLSGSRMMGMSWAEGSVRETVFSGCGMDMSSFRFSVFKRVVFADCKLRHADFQEADLRGARFERCDLTAAQFSKAQMEGTRFAHCTLAGLNGVTSLRGAIVTSEDALGLAYSLAGALGITIEDETAVVLRTLGDDLH